MVVKPELVDQYDSILDTVKIDLDEWEKKVDALTILSGKVEMIRDEVPRNQLLDIRQKLAGLKSQHERCNKLMKAMIAWADDAILLRLASEELDNYSRNGKMFYPSVSTYTSVADRLALEQYVLDRVNEGGLQIFGNTLNGDFIKNVVETTGDYPPGVSSYRKTRLNVRSR